MNNKYKNTKLVTFKEDYFSVPQGKEKEKTPSMKPVYEKDTTHAIHKDIVAKLKEKGVKMEVKDYPYEKKLAEAKKKFEASLDDRK